MLAFFEYSSKAQWIATLNLLIECKYSAPGVKWIFLPYPETSEVFSGCIKVFDQLANKRLLNHSDIESLDSNIPYCIRGISIFDSGFDENSISRGLSQLRYAMPRLAERSFRWHSDDRLDEDISLSYGCSIMVTTAPIYVLKEKISLENFYGAESLDDVALECEAVVLWNKDAPDRERYSDEIYKDLIDGDAGIKNRIYEYSKVFPAKHSGRYIYQPSLQSLRGAIGGAGDHVLVINFRYLEPYLKKIRALVKKSLKSIEKCAEVSFDPVSQTIVIKPISSNKGRSLS